MYALVCIHCLYLLFLPTAFPFYSPFKGSAFEFTALSVITSCFPLPPLYPTFLRFVFFLLHFSLGCQVHVFHFFFLTHTVSGLPFKVLPKMSADWGGVSVSRTQNVTWLPGRTAQSALSPAPRVPGGLTCQQGCVPHRCAARTARPVPRPALTGTAVTWGKLRHAAHWSSLANSKSSAVNDTLFYF